MIKYRIHYLSILLLAVILFNGCGTTETVNIHQKDREVEIDGNMSNWPTNDAIIHNSDSFRFYAMQDSEYLYVYATFRSPFYNQAVENSGFIIYINDFEKDRDARGIGFPTGAFNLLREDPATFRELTRDMEWYSNTQNRQRLESLREEVFDQVMIVERYEDIREPQYGFLSFDQIRAQGVEIAAAREQRYYGLEYKIPLDGSAPFELEPGKNYWLGFAIEPPQFTYRDDSSLQQSNRYGNQRNRGMRSSGNQGARMRQQMGQFSEWFRIYIQ